MLFKKLKASSLQYALVVSVIIAILLFAFLSIILIHKKIENKNSIFRMASLQNQYGFALLENKSIGYDSLVQINPIGDYKLKTIIKKTRWGIYDLGLQESMFKNDSFRQAAILGYGQRKRSALYLRENNQPLVVVGNTSIIGNSYLPYRGVTTGNISGVSFYGEKLIEGKIFQSNNKLPLIKELDKIQKFISFDIKNYSEQKVLFYKDSVSNSFFNPTITYKSEDEILLSDTYLKGNCIVFSNKKIQVDKTTRLEDVILIAPEIYINSGVTGSFQSIATKKIIVKENTFLNYPSSLILLKTEASEIDNSSIHIYPNSKVYGTVLYYNPKQSEGYESQLIVDTNSLVKGELFSMGNIELYGEVQGSVYAHYFITNQNGGKFINHLMNSTINSQKLPSEYAGLNMDVNSKIQVAKWVD